MILRGIGSLFIWYSDPCALHLFPALSQMLWWLALCISIHKSRWTSLDYLSISLLHCSWLLHHIHVHVHVHVVLLSIVYRVRLFSLTNLHLIDKTPFLINHNELVTFLEQTLINHFQHLAIPLFYAIGRCELAQS